MNNLHSRWLSPKAKVIKSEIFDFGIFAVKKIKKGELVSVTGGLVVTKKDIKEYREACDFDPELQIGDNFFLVPPENKDRKRMCSFNHSCNPNVGLLDSVAVVAMRDVKAGEELTQEYATWASSLAPFKCNCGSKNCRKTIRTDDWKRKEIQKKYWRYYSPYLKRKLVKGYPF
jgi:uncharacterized protein